MSDSNSGGGGLGIVGVATVVLIVLKLVEVAPVADWSWGLVLFGPFLCALVFWLVFIVFIGGVLGTIGIGGSLSRWSGRRQMRKFNAMADEEEAKASEDN